MPARHTQDDPIRRRRARKWRGLIGMGGLVLASTFFMPAVPGCNTPIIPAQEVWEVRDVLTDLDLLVVLGLAQVFLFFVAAYVWGLFVGTVAFIRLIRGSAGNRERGWGSYAVVGLAAVLVIVLTVADFWWGGSSTGFVIFSFGICPGVLTYQSAAVIRLGRRAYLAVTFVGALAVCVWFACWVLGGYYGVRLSFAASLAILLGVIGESVVLTRRSWLGTIWRLATCRLRDEEVPRAACPQCLYDLQGQTVMRCPECGRPFSLDELGLSTEDPGFEERLETSGPEQSGSPHMPATARSSTHL